MELRHYGILITILGAVLLAFSLKLKQSYDKDIVLKKIHQQATKRGLHWPSEAYIRPWFFWSGLACVAIGSLMQW